MQRYHKILTIHIEDASDDFVMMLLIMKYILLELQVYIYASKLCYLSMLYLSAL